MDLIGQQIKHKTFGSGVVVGQSESVVTICFQDDEKKFIYPDAFHSFLSMKDRKTQQYIEKQIEARDIAAQKERMAEQIRRDQQRKLSNFKVTDNSHAVFDIAPDQIDQAVITGKVYTGRYVYGYYKGQMRAADRMKPNSVCVLTTCPKERDEKERRVIGAFMVKEDFFGKDANDGVIEGHPKHRIFLPKESKVLFWEYLSPDTAPRWGNTKFKYCPADAVNRLLADMKKLLETPQQEETFTAFYRHFCRINQLSPLIKLKDETGE